MNRIFLQLTVFAALLTLISSSGFGDSSILVRADDSRKILTSPHLRQDAGASDIGKFLKEHGIHSVEDYALWLTKNIRYQTDASAGEWLAWQATIRRGYGDCKDLSILNAKVLESLGYSPLLIGYKNVSGNSFGHVFATFVKDGTFHIFDNLHYYPTPLKNLEQIGTYLYQKHHIDTVFQIDPATKSIKLLATSATLALHDQ